MSGPRASIIVVGDGPHVAAALASAQQQQQAEVLLLGDAPADAPLDASIRRVPAAGLPPHEARNAAVVEARAPFLLVVEAGERLAPDAVARHVEALAAAPAVASWGRTAVHGRDRVRLRPDRGRGGRVLDRVVEDKHLVASTACLCWRKDALGPAPFEALRAPAALRLGLAVRAARRGEWLFQPVVTAERDAPDATGAADLEDIVRALVGLLYGAEPLAPKLEARARHRLARALVSLGKHHYRNGDHRRAGKFFDEAVRAAPADFKGRRYQFMNFVKNVLTRAESR